MPSTTTIPNGWTRGSEIVVYTGEDAKPYAACVREAADHGALKNGWLKFRDPLEFNAWMKWWHAGPAAPSKPNPFDKPANPFDAPKPSPQPANPFNQPPKAPWPSKNPFV